MPSARSAPYATGSAPPAAGCVGVGATRRPLASRFTAASLPAPAERSTAETSKRMVAARESWTSCSPHGMTGHASSRDRISSAAGPPKLAVRSMDAHSWRSHGTDTTACHSLTARWPLHSTGRTISTASAGEKGRTCRPWRIGHNSRAQLVLSSPGASSTKRAAYLWGRRHDRRAVGATRTDERSVGGRGEIASRWDGGRHGSPGHVPAVEELGTTRGEELAGRRVGLEVEQ